MKFVYSTLIVVGLLSGDVLAMDNQPELVDTVLELVCRHGGLDFDFLGLMATVRKHVSIFIKAHIAPIVIERERILENDYNYRLQQKQFDRGALLTLRKDRLAYGFIGVKVLSEESCAHGEHCQLWLQWVRFKKGENSGPSSGVMMLVQTWGDPEPKTKKYPWIENFKNPAQKQLKYMSAEHSAYNDPLIINKPFFKPNDALSVEVDTFKLDDEPTTIAKIFASPSYRCECSIDDSGTISCHELE